MALRNVPAKYTDIAKGCCSVFSPRTGLDVLDMYATTSDAGQSCSCVTLAFGVAKQFKKLLEDNTAKGPIVFLLLEKKDVASSRAKDPFVALTREEQRL